MNLVDKLRTKRAATVNSSGLGKLLVPGIVIAALIAAGIFVMNSGNKVVDKEQEKGADSANSTVDGAMEKAVVASDSAQNTIPALPGVDAVTSSVTGLMDRLLASLESIHDSAGAEAALPEWNEMVSKLDGIGSGLRALPNDDRTKIGGLVRSQLEKLTPLIERISALPGMGDAVKQVLQKLKVKLSRFVS